MKHLSERVCLVREQPKESQSQRNPPAFLSCREVVLRTGLSRATIYRQVATGEFPAPYQLSKGRVGWKEVEVEEWLDSRERSAARSAARQ
jgi:prophage regulatory protein